MIQPHVDTTNDPILEAMESELRRSRQGLRVPGSPRPYYIGYALRRRRELLLEAAYGSSNETLLLFDKETREWVRRHFPADPHEPVT